MEIAAGVKLLSSPGHTPGHQSVLIETDSGNVLVAAQAAYTAEEYRQGGDVTQAHEGLEERYLQTISQLKSVAAQEVYFSHDSAAATLHDH
jgi:N-acyl homoserine lactone hydrolase